MTETGEPRDLLVGVEFDLQARRNFGSYCYKSRVSQLRRIHRMKDTDLLCGGPRPLSSARRDSIELIRCKSSVCSQVSP